jgi:hypothetical protein
MRGSSVVWIVTSIAAATFVAAPCQLTPQTRPAPADLSSGSVAITDVTVIDVTTGGRRTGVIVLTRGDRIAAIGPGITIPGDAKRVNGKGKFLTPGLWDMGDSRSRAGAPAHRES